MTELEKKCTGCDKISTEQIGQELFQEIALFKHETPTKYICKECINKCSKMTIEEVMKFLKYK